ncbi:MAG: dihydroorotate dehydrogenase electron transfer subunit, partial [Oscillospiraceae bacterium]|nr:dihydroorotate dehydrogenase electron transfer subunit [Oscillospiraceae bacterium]
MTQGIYEVEYNHPLTADVWEMRLSGDTGSITAPGQFINIQLDGLFLRRPISICDWDDAGLTVIYKVVGRGTAALAEMKPGQRLDVLCGLGNGFDISKCGQRTAVIGGGVGTPPMYGLAKALLKAGKTPVAVLGFNTKSEVFYERQFRDLGIETT